MNNKKLFALAALPVIGLGLMGTGVASAHMGGKFGFGFGPTLSAEEIASRQTAMFQEQANLLGVSVDDVKAAWAEGKSLQELATEKGITATQLQEKLKAAATAKLKSQLQSLVDKGVITQAQADRRLQVMQSATGKMGLRGMHGMHL